jgi:hypothetical protein
MNGQKWSSTTSEHGSLAGRLPAKAPGVPVDERAAPNVSLHMEQEGEGRRQTGRRKAAAREVTQELVSRPQLGEDGPTDGQGDLGPPCAV